jgi:Molecular chaperone (small heat shock protein)
MSQLVTRPNEAPVVRRESNEFIAPAVNIHQDADGYSLEVEMPGVPKGSVEVTFEDGKLTLVGRRKREEPDEHRVYRESSDADYRRVFDLDPTIDSSRIEASIEQGVLTVRLPKAEAAKPRRIAVA